MIDVGNPNIIVDDRGTLVEDEDPTKPYGYFGHTSPKLTVWVYAD